MISQRRLPVPARDKLAEETYARTKHGWQRSPLAMRAALVSALLVALPAGTAATASASQPLPEIRMHRQNHVPACVTPDRLMAFLATRNGQVEPRYRDIAKWYRHHGEAWRVRWDFAFFQMALETNFLTYRRGNGAAGDVNPRQNNFAGIGATGGGVSGDRFPDVGTGVLAQIQHLVAYSGETIERPVAPRTQLKQGDIVATMHNLRRPIRFSDLARRWAADRNYGASIATIANSFFRDFCSTSAPQPSERGNRAGWRASQLNSADGPAGPAKLRPTNSSDAVPVVDPASRARAQRVARTVWRRGEEDQGAKPPEPKLAVRPEMLANGEETPRGLLAGLQGLARTMLSAVGTLPAVPPQPQIVMRAPKIASRN